MMIRDVCSCNSVPHDIVSESCMLSDGSCCCTCGLLKLHSEANRVITLNLYPRKLSSQLFRLVL